MSRVLDDFVCGREVKTVEMDGVRHVDYNAYLRDMCLEQEEPQESVLAAPGDDEIRIFGGTSQ
jgi:hypothetical protein